MSQILVTGGAGLVGSALCKKLLSDGHSVVCLDNLSTGLRSNISSLIDLKNFKFVDWDIKDPVDMQVDAIYNLACPASPRHYQEDPINTVMTSIKGAENVLKLAKKNSCKVLQASTSEIYGNPLVHPQTETYWGNVNPIGPRACYDEGKRLAETLFFNFHHVHNVRIKVARIFNTYGPGMHENDGRVVSNFIVQALSNNNLTVYGSGEQTRSFCYVDDTVSGLISLMESSDAVTGPINIGNPNEFSVLQLASMILELTGSTSEITTHPLPEDDPIKRRPCVKYASEKLNWQPATQLHEGLKYTIDYFDKKLKRKPNSEMGL